MNQKLIVKISLYINYFVFAILLNSVGIVILKSQNVYGVDEAQVSVLEAFKDMPIVIVSFFIGTFLPRIGYKRGMMVALGVVAIACVMMFYGNAFWAAKALFAAVGVSFAIIKVAVYTLIGEVTENEGEHNSLMSSIEGVFMFGIALAYFIFPAFNSDDNPDAWLRVYWFLLVLIVASMLFLSRAKITQDYDVPGSDLMDDLRVMLGLIFKVLILVFVMSAFLFVMTEQGIMTWLPTFYNKVLSLPENVAIMMSSILAISLGVGRIVGGQLAKRFSWVYVTIACIFATLMMVMFVLPKTVEADVQNVVSIADVPAIAYAFPVVGLFIAPIYPLLNSTILSALPKRLHSPTSGLIVMFSALGGSLGSMIMGNLFKYIGADTAFYYVSIPVVGLLICVLILNKLTNNKKYAAG